jgi:hypothetical protein
MKTGRYSSVVAYPASSIPSEILLSAPTVTATGTGAEDDFVGKSHGSRSVTREAASIYMIRDLDHICDLHLQSKFGIIGKDVHIFLDFSECVQLCTVMRATLILSEKRPDGTRIQVNYRKDHFAFICGITISMFPCCWCLGPSCGQGGKVSRGGRVFEFGFKGPTRVSL